LQNGFNGSAVYRLLGESTRRHPRIHRFIDRVTGGMAHGKFSKLELRSLGWNDALALRAAGDGRRDCATGAPGLRSGFQHGAKPRHGDNCWFFVALQQKTVLAVILSL
jgi:hypothetical protein